VPVQVPLAAGRQSSRTASRRGAGRRTGPIRSSRRISGSGWRVTGSADGGAGVTETLTVAGALRSPRPSVAT
jgi:hypothetical protein